MLMLLRDCCIDPSSSLASDTRITGESPRSDTADDQNKPSSPYRCRRRNQLAPSDDFRQEQQRESRRVRRLPRGLLGSVRSGLDIQIHASKFPRPPIPELSVAAAW